MRPKIFMLDEPCDKALKILNEVFDVELEVFKRDETEAIWTGLTPIKDCNVPVFCPCTGVDHVNAPDIIYLDEEWRSGEGRKITSTAEHTWSLILQLAKLKRMQLRGKTIGIIGIFGRIGSHIRRYAGAFDMTILASDNWRDAGNSKRQIYINADIITLHVPLNESTKSMIGKREFDLMKPGALLINTSRAEIVDEDALIDALENKLGGYADDFYMNHVVDITEHPNVILTNHIGGNCIEAREATDIYIAKKAVEYWRSKNP